MQIQINTDSHIEGREELLRTVETEVEGTLGRFARQITRVEVHLNDENSHKGGTNDKRCMMEARLAGMQPIAVTHHAATIEEAVDGAAGKLARTLDRTLGKLRDSHDRTSMAGEQGL
jgi:ribosome-associated translation inhibitor RaiA